MVVAMEGQKYGWLQQWRDRDMDGCNNEVTEDVMCSNGMTDLTMVAAKQKQRYRWLH